MRIFCAFICDRAFFIFWTAADERQHGTRLLGISSEYVMLPLKVLRSVLLINNNIIIIYLVREFGTPAIVRIRIWRGEFKSPQVECCGA